MKIIKTAVVVELEDGKVYQVHLDKKQGFGVLNYIAETNENKSVEISDKPIESISLS